MARPDNEHANYYRNLPILFQIFFQVDIILKKLPRKAFLPWPNITKNKNTVSVLVCKNYSVLILLPLIRIDIFALG